MQKLNIFVIAGALTLALAAIFATKPTKIFNGVSTAFFLGGLSWYTLFTGINHSSNRLTTVSTATTVGAFFNTGSASHQLYSIKSTTSPLYYKP